MSTCPFPHATPSAVEMPPRIAALPRLRGFPVPWFVDKVDGEYDFRVMDKRKLVLAVTEGLCWVCGGKLGRHRSFVIGPMCGVNRTNAEPPSHTECARYSALACPFLSRPHMKRRDHEKLVERHGDTQAGEAILRNPGCCAVWTVKSAATKGSTGYSCFRDHKGGLLFDIGEPLSVEWYAQGRAATRAEVMESIRTGEPLLRAACDTEETPEKREEAHRELLKALEALEKHLPA